LVRLILYESLIHDTLTPSKPVIGVNYHYTSVWSWSRAAYVVTRGKTPVLSADQARQLLDSIKVAELIGLRDRAQSASWFIPSHA
jgi:hypothetical protein